MNYGPWLGWQIDYLLYLQNFRDVSHHIFDNFFIYATLFGQVTISLLLVCALYWCISKRAGQFVLFSWITGFIFNIIAKVTVCIYRPWMLDCRVKPLAQAIPAATGYSFPSGHTAGAVCSWGALMVSFWKNKFIRFFCPLIILAVMISRNYLGVHTPQDVVVSFFLSVIVVYFMFKVFNWIESDKQGGNRDLIFVGTMLAIILLTICYVELKYYPIHYLFGKILYNPHSMQILEFTRSGFSIGALLGWLIERRFIGFEPANGTLIKKIFRFIIGIIIVFAMHSAVLIIKDIGAHISIAGAFIQLMLTGFFITCIYPFVLKKFNL